MRRMLIYLLGTAFGLAWGFWYIGAFMDWRGIGADFETYFTFFGFFGFWTKSSAMSWVLLVFGGLGFLLANLIATRSTKTSSPR